MSRPRPSVSIGTLRLHLPPGHAERGASVARLVGERLAAALPRALGPERSRERLELRDLEAPAGASDQELAEAIASAVMDELAGTTKGGRRG
jgi:hypothetical protein